MWRKYCLAARLFEAGSNPEIIAGIYINDGPATTKNVSGKQVTGKICSATDFKGENVQGKLLKDSRS